MLAAYQMHLVIASEAVRSPFKQTCSVASLRRDNMVCRRCPIATARRTALELQSHAARADRLPSRSMVHVLSVHLGKVAHRQPELLSV